MNKRKILVIDDDTMMLHVIQRYLQDDYEVLITDSSKNVYDILHLEFPDLILLDYEMPLFDGASILNMIRKMRETKYIPVIFLSGKIDKAAMAKVVDNNPQGFIAKPVTKKELLDRVEDFFRHSEEQMLLNVDDNHWEL